MKKLILPIVFIIFTAIQNTDGERLPEIVLPKKENLSCYSCNSFTDNETCNTVNPNKTRIAYCPDKYLFCEVRQFSFLTNGTTKLWYLERRCKEECEDYCLGMGEKIRLFSCTKCCTGDLCNSGSGSQPLIIPLHPIFLLLISIISFK